MVNREFGLILVGDELLSGRREDKHFPHVIEMLRERGLQLNWMECVGDEPERLEAVFKRVYERSLERDSCIFSCGGIGSTPDDHTRQSAAKAFGVELELHQEAKALILERAQEMALKEGKALMMDSPEMLNRLEMGVFAKGARIIPNLYNKIPGFSFGDIHFFPGFPVMAWPMMEWVLSRYYEKDFKSVSCVERSLFVYDIGEAALTPLMQDIEAQFNGVKVFSLPSVDHPERGAHIELGVKMVVDKNNGAEQVNEAFSVLRSQLGRMQVKVIENNVNA